MACRYSARRRQRSAVNTGVWAAYMREASRSDWNAAFAAISRIEKALPQRSPQQQDLDRVERAIRDIADTVQWLAGALSAQKLP
jgi:hypothetical protein